MCGFLIEARNGDGADEQENVRVSPVFGGLGRSVGRTRCLLYKPLSVREGQVQTGESAGPAALMVILTTRQDRLTQRPRGRARSQGRGCPSSLQGACVVLALSTDSFLPSLPLSTWPSPMFGKPARGRFLLTCLPGSHSVV